MFKKLRDTEKRFYEIIGIKIFRKMAFGLLMFLSLPFRIFLSKENWKKFLSMPSNYNMKKGHGIKDLKDFKWMLLFNTSIHLWGLYTCRHSFEKILYGTFTMGQKIFMAIPIIINVYCIMLQRYNLIRIHEVEEKYAKFQELKKKREKRLEEKRKKQERELSIERIDDLISLLPASPIVNNTSLEEQGYSKVIDTRIFFNSMQEDDPFNPDYWLNMSQNKSKILTRKV